VFDKLFMPAVFGMHIIKELTALFLHRPMAQPIQF